MKYLYQVTVKTLVPKNQMDHDDANYFRGANTHLFGIEADSEEAALDEFHRSIPIACLEDFDISIDLIKKEY